MTWLYSPKCSKVLDEVHPFPSVTSDMEVADSDIGLDQEAADSIANAIRARTPNIMGIIVQGASKFGPPPEAMVATALPYALSTTLSRFPEFALMDPLTARE